MKSLAFVILSLAAGCATDGDDDRMIVPQNDYPTQPGGTSFTGRVCVASDLGEPGACSSERAGGFAVTLGDRVTETADNGTFTFPVPDSSTELLTVTGTSTTGLSIVPTTTTFSMRSVLVPAIDAELYQSVLLANGVSLGDGTGTIIANVTRDGSAASGVTVTSTPTGIAGPFYAGAAGTAWGLDGTGTSGTVMIPGVTAGTVDLSYQTVLGGLETQVNGVTVRNGGVTVINSSLPSGGTP